MVAELGWWRGHASDATAEGDIEVDDIEIPGHYMDWCLAFGCGGAKLGWIKVGSNKEGDDVGATEIGSSMEGKIRDGDDVGTAWGLARARTKR